MNKNLSAKGKFGAGSWLLCILAGGAIALIIKRFIFGIGSVTNLNDAYPWGFWIGLDVLTGVALAAGGFTLTAAIYIWGNKKYYPLARPAILTALLGYLMFVVALVIDLGRGPVMWHMFVPSMWQHDSVMFEVGWCVATYLIILIFEFLPGVLEKYDRKNLLGLWTALTPIIVIVLLTMFTYAMTYSIGWALVVLAITVLFELLQKTGIVPAGRPVPILLIMAGVLLSCLHQSSLGSLYLIVPHKLHPLWHTPVLPFLFLFSAVAVGPAMVIFEGLLSARVFKRNRELHLLSGLAKTLPFLLAIYLLLRIADIVGRGVVAAAFELNLQSVMFWVELTVGTIIPIVLLGTSEIVRSEKGLFWASLCVILGVFIHRLNVSVIGIQSRSWEGYHPAWTEILISVGIVSIGLLIFRYIARNFPIYEESITLETG